ncbi:MAG TPA: PP2C family protein-serine/threonine phosphatase [Bryobacteraceae bacterium]
MASNLHRSLTSVRIRLIVGLTAILLVVLGIAINGFWAFAAMRSSAYNATSVGGTLNSIGLEIQVHNLETYRLIELARGQNQERALPRLEEAALEIEEMKPLSGRAVRLSRGTMAEEQFRQLNSDVAAFSQAADAYIELVRRNGSSGDVANAFGRYTEAANALRNSGDDAAQAGRNAGIESAMQVQKTGQRASVVGTAISVTAICAIVLLGYMIARMLREYSRMGAELAIAQRLQRMILPGVEEIRAVPGMDIAAFTESATEVGGDYFDVIVGASGVTCSIGDVTGHGLESGVIAIMVQTAVRTLHAAGITDTGEVFEMLNRVVYDNVRRMNCDRNLTLCLLRCQNNTVTISGQHEEVLIVRANGSLERHDTLELGFPLGLEKTISRFVAEARVPLADGDVMVAYTDGVTEAINKSGAMFGIERLCEAVRTHHSLPADHIRDAVIGTVREFTGGTPALDDISLLVIKPA